MTLDEFHAKMGGHRGRDYVLTNCPFHNDRHPSLLILERGWFMCMSSACGVRGPWGLLWDKLDGILPRAYQPRDGIARANLPNPPEDRSDWYQYIRQSNGILMNLGHTQDYVRGRGVWEAAERAGLGWDNGWILFPITDINGEITGLFYRAEGRTQAKFGLRFWQPQGQRPAMYCPDWDHWLFHPDDAYPDTVYVAFGMFDALALAQIGLPAVTPTSGKDSMKAEWLDSIVHPVIIPDKYEDDAAWKLAVACGPRATVKFLSYPERTKDPADVLELYGEEMLEEILE